MKTTIFLLKTYTVVVIAAFVAGFYLFQVREMGLYLFMLCLNFPGSLITIGISESIASGHGLSLGSQSHVLILEAISLPANIAVMMLLAGSTEYLLKRRRRK